MTLQQQLIALSQRIDEESPLPPRPGSASDLMRKAAHYIGQLEFAQQALAVGDRIELAALQTERDDARRQLTDATQRIVELLKARDRARTGYNYALSELLKLGNEL